MLSNHCIEKMLGLQDVQIEKIETSANRIEIYLSVRVKAHQCPCCGKTTEQIHDYRQQWVKDISGFGKQVYIILRKRRYRCTCGKRIVEKNTFLPRYKRITGRLAAFVINQLREERSFTSVAREVNLSVSTVIRIFDCVSYPKAVLPAVLAIDEFKGNTGGEKYQCIITDPENHIVLDILPQRYSHYLVTYFKDLERSNVKYFVSDMWKVYSDFATIYFKDATQIVDKYHWIRQVIWAFEAIRKQEQKKLSKSHRLYFKRSKSLLTKRFEFLSDDEKRQVNVMLYASPTLSSAHYLKEAFLKILDCEDKASAKKLLSGWILDAQNSGIESFVKCASTMINWSVGILNSFDFQYTNGFTEGCNNKIKVLKRNAYGYRNFSRFRNRILHIFSSNLQKRQLAA